MPTVTIQAYLQITPKVASWDKERIVGAIEKKFKKEKKND